MQSLYFLQSYTLLLYRYLCFKDIYLYWFLTDTWPFANKLMMKWNCERDAISVGCMVFFSVSSAIGSSAVRGIVWQIQCLLLRKSCFLEASVACLPTGLLKILKRWMLKLLVSPSRSGCNWCLTFCHLMPHHQLILRASFPRLSKFMAVNWLQMVLYLIVSRVWCRWLMVAYGIQRCCNMCLNPWHLTAHVIPL